MTTTNTTLYQGNNKLYVHLTNDGDAEADVVVVDRSTLTGPGGFVEGAKGVQEPAAITVLCVNYAIGAADVILEWDRAVTDDVVIVMPATTNNKQSFVHVGGKHDPDPTDGTGDLIITTAGGSYDIQLWLKLEQG